MFNYIYMHAFIYLTFAFSYLVFSSKFISKFISKFTSKFISKFTNKFISKFTIKYNQ